MKWTIKKIKKNRYMIEYEQEYITFELESAFKNNPEILFDNTHNMSDDHVIFHPDVYETLYDQDPIVGLAYRYECNICVESCMVDAKIINTNIPEKAKGIIELCLL